MSAMLVIGAGMAGAACARALAERGHRVTVLDKGRSVGGRLAQRRTEHGIFDHGAQYMKARDVGFLEAVEGWVGEGAAAPWPEAGLDEPVWIGTPSMSAPVKRLLDGATIVTGCQVVRLHEDAWGWRAEDAAGRQHGPFDRVALAIPAPQAQALLASAPPGATHLAAELGGVEMAPCWAAMLAFAEPVALAAEAIRFPPGAALAWAARNRTRPGRGSAETWIVHAGPAWSRAHLEDTPEQVAARLQPDFAALAGPLPPLRAASAHRWRYALVERALGLPCLHDGALGLGLCGDWCLGPRVEAAWLSGRALGAAIG